MGLCCTLLKAAAAQRLPLALLLLLLLLQPAAATASPCLHLLLVPTAAAAYRCQASSAAWKEQQHKLSSTGLTFALIPHVPTQMSRAAARLQHSVTPVEHVPHTCYIANSWSCTLANMLIDAGAPGVECTRPGVDLSLLAVQGGLVTCCLAVVMQYVFVANSSCIFAESIRFRTAM
jgi:hypothetical protein